MWRTVRNALRRMAEYMNQLLCQILLPSLAAGLFFIYLFISSLSGTHVIAHFVTTIKYCSFIGRTTKSLAHSIGKCEHLTLLLSAALTPISQSCHLSHCNSKQLFIVWKIKPVYNTLPSFILSQQSALGVEGGRFIWTGFAQFIWCTWIKKVPLLVQALPRRRSQSASA